MNGAEPDWESLASGLDGDLHAGRIRLIDELRAAGHSYAELREAVEQDRLSVLPLEDVYRETAALTARDVATSCDMSIDEVLRIRGLLGLSTVSADEAAFDQATCDALLVLRAGRDFGMSQQAIDGLLVTLGRAMWQLASDALIILGDEFVHRGDTEYELAYRYAEVARLLAPAAVPMVSAGFQAHVRERMREIFVTPDEAQRGALRAIAEVTVAFVDVVGFTELGERVEAGELRSLASRLADAASSVIDPPVRLVKVVGDAVMLSSRDTGALLEALLDLAALLRKEPGLPAVHMGMARGPAHVGGADVYGSPVNLASRLTDLARTECLLASESVRDDDANPYPWRAREVRVKGFDWPLAVYELAVNAVSPANAP